MIKPELTALIIFFYLVNILSVRYSYRASFALDQNLKALSHEMDLALDAVYG